MLVLSSTFVFLLTYLALSTVDLAAVEARLADAVRVQASARTLLDAARRVVVPAEMARLRQALVRGDAPVCETAGFCGGELQALALDDSDSYRVRYQTRARGPAPAAAGRVAQAAVSSHVHYQSGRYEIDIRVVRVADNATLARAAVGLHVSAASGEGD
ncbi:MAG: hypothetical protein RIC38_16900 [Chromatocurvus sp.]